MEHKILICVHLRVSAIHSLSATDSSRGTRSLPMPAIRTWSSARWSPARSS